MKRTDRSNSILTKTLFLNFFNVLIHYPKMFHIAHHPEKYTPEQQYDYCQKLIKLVMRTCHFEVKAFGLENIPEKDGFYLCANHQEKFDSLSIWYTFPRRLGVILDDSACYHPFIREVCLLIRSQRLKYHNMRSIMECFKRVTQDLKDGHNYMVFPEGQYETEYNQLLKFHTGCLKSPCKAKCPIIPVAIKNSYKVFNKGLKSTYPIEIHYLKPILPEVYENMTTRELAELLRNTIQEEVNKN